MVIDIFKKKRIGNVVIRTEKTNEFFCIFTKRDFLLSLLKNHHINRQDLRYLKSKVKDLHIDMVVKADKAYKGSGGDTLIDCFKTIKAKEVG
jgi:hypothetical protein